MKRMAKKRSVNCAYIFTSMENINKTLSVLLSLEKVTYVHPQYNPDVLGLDWSDAKSSIFTTFRFKADHVHFIAR